MLCDHVRANEPLPPVQQGFSKCEENLTKHQFSCTCQFCPCRDNDLKWLTSPAPQLTGWEAFLSMRINFLLSSVCSLRWEMESLSSQVTSLCFRSLSVCLILPFSAVVLKETSAALLKSDCLVDSWPRCLFLYLSLALRALTCSTAREIDGPSPVRKGRDDRPDVWTDRAMCFTSKIISWELLDLTDLDSLGRHTNILKTHTDEYHQCLHEETLGLPNLEMCCSVFACHKLLVFFKPPNVLCVRCLLIRKCFLAGRV